MVKTSSTGVKKILIVYLTEDWMVFIEHTLDWTLLSLWLVEIRRKHILWFRLLQLTINEKNVLFSQNKENLTIKQKFFRRSWRNWWYLHPVEFKPLKHAVLTRCLQELICDWTVSTSFSCKKFHLCSVKVWKIWKVQHCDLCEFHSSAFQK